jgi:hypothetical protein
LIDFMLLFLCVQIARPPWAPLIPLTPAKLKPLNYFWNFHADRFKDSRLDKICKRAATIYAETGRLGGLFQIVAAINDAGVEEGAGFREGRRAAVPIFGSPARRPSRSTVEDFFAMRQSVRGRLATSIACSDVCGFVEGFSVCRGKTDATTEWSAGLPGATKTLDCGRRPYPAAQNR